LLNCAALKDNNMVEYCNNLLLQIQSL